MNGSSMRRRLSTSINLQTALILGVSGAMLLVALLLRISDQARRPLPDLSRPTDDDATQVVMMR